MKKTLYFFAALISMMYGCTAVQTGAPISPWDNSHTPEWNIARNAIAMQDDDQWDFIKEIVKDKSIVVLGEQMHFDITSTTARIGLLRKLHECGFTTLVFEMAPMLSGYAFGRLPSGDMLTSEDLLFSTRAFPGLDYILYGDNYKIIRMIRNR